MLELARHPVLRARCTPIAARADNPDVALTSYARWRFAVHARPREVRWPRVTEAVQRLTAHVELISLRIGHYHMIRDTILHVFTDYGRSSELACSIVTP